MSIDAIPARTRVAPSPTGDPHVGTAFMALFDLAWARKTGGAFVLRIEDTDQARLVEGSEQQIYDSLEWLGLQADEGPHTGGDFGPYRQSERLDTYRPFVEQLIADGHAYHCWCSSERLVELRREQEAQKLSVTGYDRLCLGKTREERAALPGFSETPVVRMLIPDDVPLEFEDIVRGTVKAPRPDDQVILKADGFPTYHLAVVVDDHLMGINTVVRGEEWISSTPKHVLLYDWLGWKRPAFAHMPLLRNTDKSKISKRKNPAARLMWFKEQGYLPEAVRNFLQLLGYAGDEDHEVSTFDEFVAAFSWSKVNTVGPIFDLKKLDWLNGHYIRTLTAHELADRILEFEAGWDPSPAEVEILRSAVPIIQERLVLLKDARPQLDYLFAADDALVIDDDARAGLAENAADVLDAAIAVAETVPFSTDAIQAGLRERIVEGMGIKPKFAFAPIRVAISGRKVSPPLFESMEILGREPSLVRLRALRASL
ncbi:glutamate--tRNA ligase [Tessaracoccus sp. G1721]